MNMEELGMFNDMPRGWITGKDQPLWHRRVYGMWKRMWDRVTNVDGEYYENYKDCKIHEDFKYLSNYVDWIIQEPRFEEFCNTCDTISWSVDKDAKQSDNRNYYPECMTLTTNSENVKEMLARKGTRIPKIPVIGIKDNSMALLKSMSDGDNRGFNRGNIYSCINKRLKTHKGYKWYKVNYKHNLRLRKMNN